MKTLNPKEIIQAQQAMCTLKHCLNEADLESIKLQVENSVKLLEGKIKEIVPILQLTLEDESFKVVFAPIDDEDDSPHATNFILDDYREFAVKDMEIFHYEEKFIKAYLNLLTYQQ